MGVKKIIIITVAAAGLVGLSVFAYVFLNRAPKTADITNQTNDKTSGTGELNKVTPGGTTIGRNQFSVFSDPLNPYATNLPRTNEPVNLQPNRAAAPNFTDYEKAVANGEIPDKNGMYAQKVTDTSPLAPFKNQQYNFTLPAGQFLQDYYPQAASIIAGNLGDENSNIPNPDDPLTIEDPANNVPDSIALVDGVDPKLFKTKKDNGADSLIAYAKQISDATAEMDLIHDDTFTLNLTSIDDLNILNQLKTASLSIQGKIKALTVPSNLLGLAQAYYALHGQFANLVEDQANLVKAQNDSQVNAALKALNDHAKLYGVSDGQIRLDAMIIKKMIQQQQQ